MTSVTLKTVLLCRCCDHHLVRNLTRDDHFHRHAIGTQECGGRICTLASECGVVLGVPGHGNGRARLKLCAEVSDRAVLCAAQRFALWSEAEREWSREGSAGSSGRGKRDRRR